MVLFISKSIVCLHQVIISQPYQMVMAASASNRSFVIKLHYTCHIKLHSGNINNGLSLPSLAWAERTVLSLCLCV